MCVILWWNKLFYCPCFVLWFLWNCLYALKDSGPGCVAMCAHFPVALDRVWYLNSFISYDTANDTPLWHVGLSALVILTGNYQHTAVHEFCSFFFFFLWVLVSLVIWEALKSLDIASLANSLIDFFKNSVQTRADIFLNFTINPCLIVKNRWDSQIKKHFADLKLPTQQHEQQQHSDIWGCCVAEGRNLTTASQSKGETMSSTEVEPKDNKPEGREMTNMKFW